MLQKGEIDLMAGVSYAEGRTQTMLFSDLPMGEENITCMQTLPLTTFPYPI